MRQVRLILAGSSLALSLGGCQRAPELGAVPQETVRDLQVSDAGSGDAPGYVHTIGRSKFHIGTGTSSVFEYGLNKLVGSDGVFGIVPETGWVLAIPNAGSSSTTAGPLTTSEEDHNQAVVSYFVTAGLPANQVGRVDAHAKMHGSGTASGGGFPQNPVLDGFDSVITRVVQGVAVPDSFAWAEFNALGEVVEEQVYWPPLTGSVVAAALELSGHVSDPSRNAFLGQLPGKAATGSVVIRHSPGSQKTGFEAVACYDVSDRGPVGMGRVRHFDGTGAELTLTSERPPPLNQVSRTR